MPRGRQALASVCLCLVCLIVLMPQLAARPCAQDTIKKVQHLINVEAPKLKGLNCSLYTPTVDHYKKCPGATMKCFAGEMIVLLDEWEITEAHLTKLKTTLTRLAEQLNTTESGCIQCELFEVEAPETFLRNLLKTLHEMNTVHCPKKTR
ncbi:interleukin 15, like isoform X2 [Dicentrarchus labrax]|uniref:Interleukin n=1 Tax=Dicentrarchus labrax TaxID=13489 RepID=A0A8P4G8S5_DICLA|nr:interleukin 15, like isoform X2 [Dicentrarchus labrax]